MSALAIDQAAKAQNVEMSFSGTLTPGNIDYAGLFGPAGGTLGALPFTANFSYNPSDFQSMFCWGLYGNAYGAFVPSAMTINITVIGKSFSYTSPSASPPNCNTEYPPAQIALASSSEHHDLNSMAVWSYGAPNYSGIAYYPSSYPTDVAHPLTPTPGSGIFLGLATSSNTEEDLAGALGGLTVVSPFLLGAKNLGDIDLATLLPNLQTSDSATALAADGTSAAIVLFQVNSMDPVTFTTNNATTLFSYKGNQNFLKKAPSQGVTTLDLVIPIHIGSLLYAVALLQAPPAGTAPNYSTPITVTAQQKGGQIQQAYLPLVPPPVLLVHGIWGTSRSLAGIQNYLKSVQPWQSYPSLVSILTYPADIAFDSKPTENDFGIQERSALAEANLQGIIAGRVDIVAHSMGGLVARHYSGVASYHSLGNRLQGAFHQIVTLDTPEQGSALASFLEANAGNIVNPPGLVSEKVIEQICPKALKESYTAANCLEDDKEPISSGVASLEPGSPNLNGLPSPNIPNTIWNVVSSTISQSGYPQASALLFGLNYLIISSCSGPAPLSACAPYSTDDPPDVEQILGTEDNDGVVPLSSQTAGCAQPSCQIASFSGLAHNKITELKSVGGLIFNNANVEDNEAVSSVAACWLSTAGSPTCNSAAATASNHARIIRVSGAASASNAVEWLNIAPPADAQLAVPFDLPVHAPISDVNSLTVTQRDEIGNYTDQVAPTVTAMPGGQFLVRIIPTLMGQVTYRISGAFKGGDFFTQEFTLPVHFSGARPRWFRADGAFAELHGCLSEGCSGGELRYLTHPRAVFETAPEQEVDLAGRVSYRLLPSSGLPVIRLNKDGSFKNLRVGKAVVEEQFGGAVYDITIAVDPE